MSLYICTQCTVCYVVLDDTMLLCYTCWEWRSTIQYVILYHAILSFFTNTINVTLAEAAAVQKTIPLRGDEWNCRVVVRSSFLVDVYFDQSKHVNKSILMLGGTGRYGGWRQHWFKSSWQYWRDVCSCGRNIFEWHNEPFTWFILYFARCARSRSRSAVGSLATFQRQPLVAGLFPKAPRSPMKLPEGRPLTLAEACEVRIFGDLNWFLSDLCRAAIFNVKY